jgi:alpha-L-rhamnosidase
MSAFEGKWIKPRRDFGDVCPAFVKEFTAKSPKKAALTISAMGVYEARLNGARIGGYVLAPGWTTKRLQYQVYDLTNLLQEHNTLTITVGKGWYRSPLAGWLDKENPQTGLPAGLCAQLAIDGQLIETDAAWKVCESPVRFSEIYDGELYDANISGGALEAVEEYPGPGWPLVPQQGEEIREKERLRPAAVLITPKKEIVIDFGQNLTGYVELSLPAQTKAGSRADISFAETLDKEGNFYTDNYRSAKSKMQYICKDGVQQYKPKFTFFGFRYIRLDSFPVSADPSYFTAIAVYSDMERTGSFECSHPLVNRLYENVIWGQRGNFLDVPTDCPQRDERLGWTGDAQAFIKAAAYNYDVERFFSKWLADVALEQLENGMVHHVIPNVLGEKAGGAPAWADAAAICPWEIYLSYGDKTILENQFSSMCKWVDYITAHTKDRYLWTGGSPFGDWLALDSPPEHIRGSTRDELLASAFYANSANLAVKAGKVLGRDVSAYESLYANIVKTFLETYTDFRTQTEHVLALHFGLTGGRDKEVAKSLADKIIADGGCLQTGFVGTPYLLHVLSANGYTELAYSLLLREEYPSWLYPVTKNATTIWERWDSIKPNGDFQTTEMNSFNHYAYGAVADWLYGVAAGIKPVEDAPGYRRVYIAPQADPRLGWLSAGVKTRQGLVSSRWQYTEGRIRYDIETPGPAEIRIGDRVYHVDKGCHVFYG